MTLWQFVENDSSKVRRHDIDWLRVILFALLIPFHVAIGVYWNLYGENVNPDLDSLNEDERWEIAEDGNDYTTDSVDFQSMILHWMHQWRLAGLFMISGILGICKKLFKGDQRVSKHCNFKSKKYCNRKEIDRDNQYSVIQRKTC